MLQQHLLTVAQGVAHLRQGHIIAYPTEAVYGLGCHLNNEAAVKQLLALKQRPQSKGLIVIASNWQQVRSLTTSLSATQRATLAATWPGPVTWVLPANSTIPAWICGEHDSIAVRYTAHPIAAALCELLDSPIISTSANKTGEPPVRALNDFSTELLQGLAGVVTGELGTLAGPTPIYDLLTGQQLRY